MNMATSGLNFENLTPDNGAVRELSALIFENVITAGALNKITNVMGGQYNGDKIGLIGEFGLVGKAAAGCNPTYNKDVISTSEKTWSLNEWGVYEQICYDELEGTLVKYAMQKGINRADLTSTQYMADIIMPRMQTALEKMLFRLAWFGDTTADTTANAGVLKVGTDKAYFTVTDGLWKRILAITAADASRRTTIAANAEATIAAQKTAIKTAGVATGIMDSLIEDAPVVLRGTTGQVIYITLALKDALDADIRANNKGSELQWQEIFAGIKETTYNGINVVVLPMWDEIIKTYEGTATAWHNPYRAVYTVKDNLLVGIESMNEFAKFDVWFNKDEQLNKILSRDRLGTNIAQDNLIQVAY
jgi:hypothetical protein